MMEAKRELFLQRVASIAAVLLISCTTDLRGQSPDWLWARSVNGGGAQSATSEKLAIGEDGSVVVTGWFEGSFDLDPGAGSTSVTSAGEVDIFLLKLDANGDLVWANRIGGSGMDRPRDVTVDENGSVILTGDFQNTVDLDPGVGTVNYTAVGDLDAFVACFSASGELYWAGVFSGPSSEQLSSVVTGANNSITLGGWSYGPLDVDPGPDVVQFGPGGGAFVCQLDSDGVFLDVAAFYGSDIVICEDLALDSDGALVMVGTFSGSVDLDPGVGALEFTAELLNSDAFALRMDPFGVLEWATSIPSSGSMSIRSVDLTPGGSMVASGYFRDSVDLDPGPGLDIHVSNGGEDVFMFGLSREGEHLWSASFGGLSNEYCYEQAIDPDQRIWITGFFTNVVDFDPGPGTTLLDALGPIDAYVSEFDTTGTWLGAFQMGGVDDDVGSTVGFNGQGDLYVAGSFDSNSMTLGPFTVTSVGGGADVFIAKAGALSTGSNEFGSHERPVLYPNPVQTSSSILIMGAADVRGVDVLDATGRLRVQRTAFSGAQVQPLGLHGLEPGAYLVRFFWSNGGWSCRSLIVH